ncbi:MAG: serine/threonine-protein phosphatase, partial [Leptospiraceae bacterium]|nr:serine/threonine-protein phosphatase [Leptospiraceae bacterium]
KEKFDLDLKLARNIQESLFPKLNSIPGLKYEVFRQTHNQLGGDFFDFVRLREGNTGVFMTDVAGHGISSAMVAAMLKVIISTIPYTFKLDPSAFLTYLDEKLASEYSSEHATAIYIYINFLRTEISIANAGHPYIIYQKAGEEFKEIETEGSLIGYGIRKPLADTIKFNYGSGDRFFIYTDGLIENSGNDDLGSEGIVKILNQFKDSPIHELKSLIVQEIALHYQTTVFTDDVMFILAELE